MTALDQAFIKAFTQQGSPTTTAPLRSAMPMSEHPPVPLALETAPAVSATLDGVLAALEKPPRATASLLKAEGRLECAQRMAEEADDEQWAVGLEQWAVGGGQWEVGSEQWAAPSAQWAVSSGQYCTSPNPIDEDVRRPTVLSPQDGDASSLPPPPPPRPAIDPSPTIPLYPDTPLPLQQFQPTWRVDHFTWPKVCRRLIARAAGELDRLADALSAASLRGQKVLAIAGYRRGEGATTLLLCAARRLAERGIKLLLIDADLARPRLARRLSVQPQYGWNEITVEEGASFAAAIVEAAANNLALLPVREPPIPGSRPVGDRSCLAPCIKTLRNHYDMLLVDLGPLEDAGLADGASLWAMPGAIDAIVLTHDERITSEEQLIEVQERLAAVGIAAVGIVENFVAEG